jgi:hypothetical protein
VADIDGYRVVTTEGKTIGRVAGESQLALVVECGNWPRKVWHALPKAHASVKEEERRIIPHFRRDLSVTCPILRR